MTLILVLFNAAVAYALDAQVDHDAIVLAIVSQQHHLPKPLSPPTPQIRTHQTLLLMFLPDVDAGKKAMGGAKQSDPEGSSLFCFGAQRLERPVRIHRCSSVSEGVTQGHAPPAIFTHAGLPPPPC